MAALVLTLAAGGAARAQTSFTVEPAQPTTNDRPLFTFIYTAPGLQCHPDFSPFPQISGNQIVFQGTASTSPYNPTCAGSWLTDWELDPLPAGTYSARVEVDGVLLAALLFDVGNGGPPPPSSYSLSVEPEDPIAGESLLLTVSGFATGTCAPHLDAPEVRGTTITIAGNLPLYPVTPDCEGSWAQTFSAPPLPAGTYVVQVLIDDILRVSVDVRVAPPPVSGGALQVDPRLPTTADPLTFAASVESSCAMIFGAPSVDGDRIVLPASVDPAACVGLPAVYTGSATLGPLPAGAYTAELTVGDTVVAAQGVTVTAPTTTLSLVDGRFAVTLTRAATATGGPGGPGFAVPLTDQSGYFWFFDSGNVEVTVKILDGRPVTGHFWLFAASMTDVPFTLLVTDLGSPSCAGDGTGCPVKSYTTTAGRNENFIDLGSL